MAEDTTAPQIDLAKMKDFGVRIFNLFGQHETDRKAVEDRWLKNLRQYRGIYDPEILAKIPSDCSKAYPKMTRWKCIGTVARLMQMLFPQTEKNYGLKPSPLPNLESAQLQEVLDSLVAKKAHEQQIAPEQVRCTNEEIEKAISDYAEGKAKRMEKKIDDDLQEMDYTTLARRVVFSAVLYNVGILKGPMHKTYKARTWRYNEVAQKYEVQEVEKYQPLFEFCPVWNYYPDLTAKTLDAQDGEFELHVMTRAQVQGLADRPDFLKDVIDHWLHEHKNGNHKVRHWEAAMNAEPKSDRASTPSVDERKYDVMRYFGAVTGHEIKAAGIEVKDSDLGRTFTGDVWAIGDTIIKCMIAPLSDAKQYHQFVFEEDDLSLLGNGQCDTLRDSQISICEATRMALDEASFGGENMEINTDLLTPGQDYSMRSYKIWKREGEGNEANLPAVRPIQRRTRLAELQSLVAMFTDFADKESGLPPPSLGDVTAGGSEALRTQKNASMFLGAAALPIRDTVRNYDNFTVSVVGSLVQWNNKYDPNPDCTGDPVVIARGSTSLIAKEVLSTSLDALRATLTEDELPHIKPRELLKMRMQARDIPIDNLMEPEDVAEQNIAAQQAAAQEAATAQAELIDAQVKEYFTRAAKNLAQASQAEASIPHDVMKLLLDAFKNANDSERKPAKAGA